MPPHDKPAATHTQNGHKPDADVRSAVEAERALAEALYAYAGQWVAVENHVVVDCSSDLETLVGRLNGQRASAEIFQVQADLGGSALR